MNWARQVGLGFETLGCPCGFAWPRDPGDKELPGYVMFGPSSLSLHWAAALSALCAPGNLHSLER